MLSGPLTGWWYLHVEPVAAARCCCEPWGILTSTSQMQVHWQMSIMRRVTLYLRHLKRLGSTSNKIFHFASLIQIWYTWLIRCWTDFDGALGWLNLIPSKRRFLITFFLHPYSRWSNLTNILRVLIPILDMDLKSEKDPLLVRFVWEGKKRWSETSSNSNGFMDLEINY